MMHFNKKFWGWLFARIVKPASRHNQISRFRGTGEASIPVKIRGDILVCVPDSLEAMTSYILLEQEDWFEDEIEFVRRLLKPGMNVIDIGANYGVYTLSMAKAVAPGGRVYAFEPTRKTAHFLNAGVALNKFKQVQVINAALSNFNGDGILGVERNSELNRLVSHAAPDTAQETVRVCTLDSCESVYDWTGIDFIKLDAEGAECSIIEGGTHFFASHTPLLLVEFKHGQIFNFPLIPAFADIGYSPYRLVPGLQILVPFEAESAIEPFQLNLFFCKPDQARLLEERGFLTTELNPDTPALNGRGWRDFLSELPYARRLMVGWASSRQKNSSSDVHDYEAALDFYALARQENQHPGIRYAALRQALASLVALTQTQTNSNSLHLMSLARIYADMGLRSNTLYVLAQLREIGDNLSSTYKNEPFLAVSERFDSVDPGNELGNWIVASVLDQWEILSHFSGYFMGMASLENLETIRQLGFCKQDIEKRILLLRMRRLVEQ